MLWTRTSSFAQVNANGLTLKKKQLWTLEAFGDNTDAVCLRSHLDKYLSVDQVSVLHSFSFFQLQRHLFDRFLILFSSTLLFPVRQCNLWCRRKGHWSTFRDHCARIGSRKVGLPTPGTRIFSRCRCWQTGLFSQDPYWERAMVKYNWQYIRTAYSFFFFNMTRSSPGI